MRGTRRCQYQAMPPAPGIRTNDATSVLLVAAELDAQRTRPVLISVDLAMENYGCFALVFFLPKGIALDLSPSTALNAQSPHRPHDRDWVPDIPAAWRLEAAISQRLRNLAVGLVAHRF